MIYKHYLVLFNFSHRSSWFKVTDPNCLDFSLQSQDKTWCTYVQWIIVQYIIDKNVYSQDTSFVQFQKRLLWSAVTLTRDNRFTLLLKFRLLKSLSVFSNVKVMHGIWARKNNQDRRRQNMKESSGMELIVVIFLACCAFTQSYINYPSILWDSRNPM